MYIIQYCVGASLNITVWKDRSRSAHIRKQLIEIEMLFFYGIGMLCVSQQRHRLVPQLNPDPERHSFLCLSQKRLVSHGESAVRVFSLSQAQQNGVCTAFTSPCFRVYLQPPLRTPPWAFSFFTYTQSPTTFHFPGCIFSISDSCSPAAALLPVLLALVAGLFEVVPLEAAGLPPGAFRGFSGYHTVLSTLSISDC